ncbi:hypothetical protein T439DRAFT_327862 [Meredithblackwellia eburnea MCA 4105]
MTAYFSGWIWSLGLRYFARWPWGEDRKAFSISVAVLLMLDLLGTVGAAFQAFVLTVKEWGNVAFLTRDRSPFGFNINPIITGIVAAIVQLFYAYRVWVVSGRKRVIPIIICILTFIQFGFALGATVITFKFPISTWRARYLWGASIWLSSEAIVDILITSSIVFYLRQATKKSDFEQTNSIVSRILRGTMENNSATCAMAITDALVFACTLSYWHVFCNQLLPKFYTLSFIITLNSRASVESLDKSGRTVHHIPNAQGHGSHPTSTFTTSAYAAETTGGENRAPVLSILVTRSEQQAIDIGEPVEGDSASLRHGSSSSQTTGPGRQGTERSNINTDDKHEGASEMLVLQKDESGSTAVVSIS